MLEDESGNQLGAGEIGELVVRGRHVMRGYWNDPDLTAARYRSGALSNERICYTGDLFQRDEAGFYYFVSRKDDMIKTSGYRVSPTELEESVYVSGLVGEVVALGLPHPVLGQAIVLVATPPSGGALDTVALMASCRRDLPAYMLPREVVERSSLPRNPNGKLDRKALALELSDPRQEKAS